MRGGGVRDKMNGPQASHLHPHDFLVGRDHPVADGDQGLDGLLALGDGG